MTSRALMIGLVGGLVGMGAACGPTPKKGPGDGGAAVDGDTIQQPHKLAGITITPNDTILELDLNTPGAQAFTAIGNYLDGVPEDLTPLVTWSASNPAVGAMSGATLEIPGFAVASAQSSKIAATFDGFTGEAQITVVAYRKTGAQTDFFFILPYVDPAGIATKPLDFSTTVPSLDVFFLMDTTGSMGDEITNLQGALTNTVVPGIRSAVADSQFGVGAFMDFPTTPYGSTSCSNVPTSDQPFRLSQAITSTITSVQTGVNSLSVAPGIPNGCGYDWPESNIDALYQVSTGSGISGGGASVPPNTTGIGGVGFRAGTMPVVVDMTDAVSHAKGEAGTCTIGAIAYEGAVATASHTRAETKTALANVCARVVGVASINQAGVTQACTGQGDLEDFATATGALVPPAAWDFGTRPAGCAATQCCTGLDGAGRAPNGNGQCPVVFQVAADGAGLGTSIVTGIQMLTRFATFDVTSERLGVGTDVDNVPLPTPHTTADFIKMITPVGFVKPPAPPVLPDPTFDATAFHTVTPGTKVSFDVAAFNDFVMQTGQAQFFKATIRVLAGGCTPLDQREVLILVPPAPIVIQ